MTAPTLPHLGIHVGNPNQNEAEKEGWFVGFFNRAVELLGARPRYMNAFTDFTIDPSQWVSNAEWTSASWKRSAVISDDMIPVVGIPLSDGLHWARGDGDPQLDNEAFFDAIIAGTHDSVYRGIGAIWATRYPAVDFRPGYEFNGGFMPWFMTTNRTSWDERLAVQRKWVQAFERVADLLREGVALTAGATCRIVWNPAMMGWTPISVRSAVPNPAKFDLVGIDVYSTLYPLDFYDWWKGDGTVTDAADWAANDYNRRHFWTWPSATQWVQGGNPDSGFGIRDAVEICLQHGKPLCIPECGAVQDAAFPRWLKEELGLAAERGVDCAYICAWLTKEPDGDWMALYQPGSTDVAMIATMTAWQVAFGIVAPEAAGDPPPVPTPPYAVGTFTDDTGMTKQVILTKGTHYAGDTGLSTNLYVFDGLLVAPDNKWAIPQATIRQNTTATVGWDFVNVAYEP